MNTAPAWALRGPRRETATQVTSNDEPRVLIAEVNPYGNLEAMVEDDGRTVYLYLQHVTDDGWGLRPVWVANHLPAPEGRDMDAMEAGMAPLMPREGTHFPQGGPALDEDRLSLVWFEEGDGAALLEGDRPVAIVAPWSGEGGFPGYSAAAVGTQELAWELGEALDTLGERVKRAAAYWRWREQDESWEEIREAQLDHLERHLGPHRRYWAADGGTFPPGAVVQFTPPSHPGVFVYTTLGMSAQAMPRVEMHYEDPAPCRRVELALGARDDSPEFARTLSWAMGMPWRDCNWLGDGHTISWDEAPAGGVLLLAQPPAAGRAGLLRRPLPPPSLPGFTDRSGDPVTYLWLMKISLEEQSYAEKHSSAKLAAVLERNGRGWLWESV